MPREYVHRKDLVPGMLVQADEGFKCLDPYEICEVHMDEQQRPYVICHGGIHHLTGSEHLDVRGRVIGFCRCKGMN